MEKIPNEPFAIDRQIKILSEPSCLSTDLKGQDKAYSHFNVLADEILDQLSRHIRSQLKDLVSYDKNYGNTIIINIRCETLLASDLLNSTVLLQNQNHS